MHTEYQTHKPRCVGCQVWLGSARGLAITVYPSLMTPSLRRGPWKRGLAFHRQPVPHHFLAFWAPSVHASPLASATGLLFSLPPLSASTTCSMSSGKAKVGIRATHNVIPEDLSAITVILFLVDSLLFIDSLIPQFFTTNFPSSYFQLLATFLVSSTSKE